MTHIARAVHTTLMARLPPHRPPRCSFGMLDERSFDPKPLVRYDGSTSSTSNSASHRGRSHSRANRNNRPHRNRTDSVPPRAWAPAASTVPQATPLPVRWWSPLARVILDAVVNDHGNDDDAYNDHDDARLLVLALVAVMTLAIIAAVAACFSFVAVVS